MPLEQIDSILEILEYFGYLFIYEYEWESAGFFKLLTVVEDYYQKNDNLIHDQHGSMQIKP